jgi:hypothetical protein
MMNRFAQVSPIFSVKEEDMVYANYKAGIVATPFAVVLDHAWKSVIVAIRGSASINDFICDLAFSRCSLDDYGIKYGFDGKDKFAHKGMLDCAEWITKDLLEYVLDYFEVLCNVSVCAVSNACFYNATSPNQRQSPGPAASQRKCSIPALSASSRRA